MQRIRVPTYAVRLPEIRNEPMADYAPGSADRKALAAALTRLNRKTKSAPIELQSNLQGPIKTQQVPFRHSQALCSYVEATEHNVKQAIDHALSVRPQWEAMPFSDRAAIFLKAADLLTTKYKYDVLAATMLGQGKNAWQAEIDAAAELADFWRFNVKYAAEIYADQPTEHFKHTWNRMEHRPLEGFVAAFSPFNFTAIGGNLSSAPALMGNVVLWKPSPMAMYSNALVMQVLKEAGLPDGVIQFVPGDAEMVSKVAFSHPDFAGLHFTGSTHVFKHLWKTIGNNLDVYKSYPRVVGETGGKNMHFLHKSADVEQAVLHTIRSAFEYNGQKCSACSRVYVPDVLWPEFKKKLVEQMESIKMGSPEDFESFVTAVINKQSYDKIMKFVNEAKSDPTKEVISGGTGSDKEGYFIKPTAIVTKDPLSATMTTELFGPVLTIYVYPANQYEETLHLADRTTAYALTAGLFAQDREALITGMYHLRNAAGNIYINDKSTGAIVGQQAFGGARASGTNDKAGSALNLLRWVSPRTIKENFVPIKSYTYPSNLRD